MKISGFSYIRNGFKYGYPFLQSIQSILPICDEFIISVGNSEDGTREAIINIGSPKIKIIDTVWDEKLRANGQIFAQQANIALKETTGEWVFHIQADEVIHEQDLEKIREHINIADNDKNIEGLLFDFYNFYGNYNFLNNTRYQHKKEIRIFRNHLNIYSYRDSQGFRRYPSYDAFINNHKGFKLNVNYIHIPVYHYSYVRNPQQMNIKSKYFASFWHEDQEIDKSFSEKQEFDYYSIERIKNFVGTHPVIMKEVIDRENWAFNPDKIKKALPIIDQIVYWIEDRVNYRFGEYKNYKII